MNRKYCWCFKTRHMLIYNSFFVILITTANLSRIDFVSCSTFVNTVKHKNIDSFVLLLLLLYREHKRNINRFQYILCYVCYTNTTQSLYSNDLKNY